MPLYEFVCNECGVEFEKLTPYDKINKTVCESCGSKDVKKLVSKSNFVGCSDLKNFDHEYRFKTNLPKVLEQRQRAEEMSHMGKTPYKHIDDSKASNFDKII